MGEAPVVVLTTNTSYNSPVIRGDFRRNDDKGRPCRVESVNLRSSCSSCFLLSFFFPQTATLERDTCRIGPRCEVRGPLFLGSTQGPCACPAETCHQCRL